jgi:hypothetical protein
MIFALRRPSVNAAEEIDCEHQCLRFYNGSACLP